MPLFLLGSGEHYFPLVGIELKLHSSVLSRKINPNYDPPPGKISEARRSLPEFLLPKSPYPITAA